MKLLDHMFASGWILACALLRDLFDQQRFSNAGALQLAFVIRSHQDMMYKQHVWRHSPAINPWLCPLVCIYPLACASLSADCGASIRRQRSEPKREMHRRSRVAPVCRQSSQNEMRKS